MPKQNISFVNILKKIAPKIGAKVIVEPQWGVVTQIIFKNGKKRYTRYNTLDVNTMGASEISKDKAYSTFFLKKMGYSVITGKAFYSDKWARIINSKDNKQKAYIYASQLGFPVVVKPNSKSQGIGVTLVHNKREFFKALKTIFEIDKVVLVQKYIKGKDYRIVVFGDGVISAYQRVPLSLVGDGKSSIKELFDIKKKLFEKTHRDFKIKIDDQRIKNKLKKQNLSIKSILKTNEIIFLLDNANLSTGGNSIDVTNTIHPEFKKLAISITKDMGLKLCGVDIMVSGDIANKPKKYWVIEINSAPGLDHYITTGKKQVQIVENMYLEILKSIQ